MDLSNENIIHIKKTNIEYLQFRKLLEYNNLVHAYSIGLDNNFKIENLKDIYDEKNLKSYRKIAKELEVDFNSIIRPEQKHTENVEIVENKINVDLPDINNIKNTDGLITNKKDIMLATTNADCILLLFYDPVKNVIANVHSGWKGTVKRIAINTVQKMINNYNCKAKDIICCIAPSIRKCHFEVEKDVMEIFKEEFKDLKNLNEIIEEKIPNKKWNIDTVLINKTLLVKEGLKQENIIDSKICSVCNSKLIHSYRVEKQGFKLNAAFIEMK